MDLSQEQTYAFERFKRGENLFITGQGGTGKTRLIETLVGHCKRAGIAFQVCALTGCATILLPDNCKARTIHSWSGIRLCKGENRTIVSNALKSRTVKSVWKKVRVLIVDEVSMMSVKMLEVLDTIARRVRGIEKAFGGIQVVFVGDFYQLPPVGTAGDPTTEQFCFESEIWGRIFPKKNHIELKTIFRQLDPLYREILSQIRTATLTEKNCKILDKYVKREYDAAKYNGCVPPKLYPTRAKADYLNGLMYNRLDGQEYTYEYKRCGFEPEDVFGIGSLDSKPITQNVCVSKEEFDYECDQLMNMSSFQESLTLKVGAVVMCTVNWDMDNGISNGSQGVITRMETSSGCNYPVVKFTNGVEQTITHHYIKSEDYPSVKVGQIPLCLAWAMTIHKIQGATLATASIDVGGQIFEYGQTYVALSRVQSLDGLYLSAFQAYKIRANPRVVEFYSRLPAQDYVLEPLKMRGSEELQEDLIVDPNIKRIRL
jgi:ATP-dependent DNA helicase PIF1